MPRRLTVSVVAALASLALVAPAAAHAAFGVSSFTVTPNDARAGAHPNVVIHIGFSSPEEQVKSLRIHMPPGLVGDPSVTTKCTEAQFGSDTCPASSEVGTVTVDATATVLIVPTAVSASGVVYNVEPRAGEPARLGVKVNAVGPLITQHIPVTVGLRPDDYGLDTTIDSVPNTADGLGLVPLQVNSMDMTLEGHPSGASGPFMTNPTTCQTATTRIEASSYTAPGTFHGASASYLPTHCDTVPFDPTLNVELETSRADSPSGYTVTVGVPPGDSGSGQRRSHVKRTAVVLPKGTTLSPPSAVGMSACTDAQFGKGTAAPLGCPANSKLGDVEIDTPLLGTLHGAVYLGTPTASAPLRLFVNVQEHGLTVRVTGLVTPAAADGQVTTVFDDLPQVPFTAFRLMFRGGPTAILANPAGCGSYTATASVTPWSGGPNASPTNAFPISDNGSGGACPAKRPFAPGLSALFGSTLAGGDPGFMDLVVDRPDRDQRLKRLKFSLPPGALGKLASVPACPEASAATGACPDSSRVGTVSAAVGAGPAPAALSGPVYVGGPYKGAIASLITVLPGKVGPLDVGTVVLRNALSLRSSDGGVDVASDDLPAFQGGIPVAVRRLSVKLDRPGFLLNPTSCAPLTVNSTITSAEGDTASPTAPFQATGCDKLPFAPRITAIIGGKGETASFRHPFLRTIIEQSAGEASIRTTAVTLPPVVGPDINALQNACAPEVAQSPTATCPANTRIGTATARSPLLPLPLTGPVYLMKVPGQPVPGIILDLKGLISLKLPGVVKIDAQRRLVTEFDTIPDVPIERFELEFTGGKGGSLQSVKNLCSSRTNVSAAFGAHSGAQRTVTSPLLVSGCATTAALKLSKVGKGKPQLDLSLRGAPQSVGFAQVQLSLPRALRGVSRKARRGVTVYAAGKKVRSAKVRVRKSQILLTGLPINTQNLKIVMAGGALKPSKALLGSLARHRKPRLTFGLRTADAGKAGKSSLGPTVRLRARPRS